MHVNYYSCIFYHVPYDYMTINMTMLCNLYNSDWNITLNLTPVPRIENKAKGKLK